MLQIKFPDVRGCKIFQIARPVFFSHLQGVEYVDRGTGGADLFSHGSVQIGAELVPYGFFGDKGEIYSAVQSHDIQELSHILCTLPSGGNHLVRFFFHKAVFPAGDKRVDQRQYNGGLQLCQPLRGLIHITGTDNGMVDMNVVASHQQRDDRTAQ